MSDLSAMAWRPIKLLTVTLLCGGIATACSDVPDSPTAPPANHSINPRVGALRTVAPSGAPHFAPNTASDQLAKDVPGFGGAFVADGVLNVYLTPDANTAQGQATARSAVSSLFAAGHRPEMPIKFLSAKYSFTQLRTWENALKNYFQRLGVRTAQVDERANGFKISLSSSAAEQALRAQLAALGIPTEIVVSKVGGPVVPLTDLNWQVRPAGGGLRIHALFNYQGSAYNYGCTYGFNAQIDDGSGTRYMVTNSHCVQPDGTLGGFDGAQVAQPDSDTSMLIGIVTANPPAQGGIVGCAAGDVCRESDAVLVQANEASFPVSAWDIGGIARTTYRGTGPNSSGSTTINGRITISNASTVFFAGDVLEKIGATTGWTAGTVTGTCVYGATPIPGTTARNGRMCNGVVAAGSNHGDSGSPVFWQDTNGKYHLMGILWGGTNIDGGHNSDEFYFSRWQNIKDDLSPYNNLLVTPSSGGGSGCVPQPGQVCPV